MIYVPSKSRAFHVEKNLPSWLGTGLPVRIVAEPQDRAEYSKVIQGRAKLLILPKNDRGVSYARNHVIKHAIRNGLSAIIMCDDDYQTSPGVGGMIERSKTLPSFSGIGGYVRIYEHFMRIAPDTGLQRLSGGMGMNVMVLNPIDVKEVGGYDEKIRTHDDVDLRIRLQVGGKGDWYVDTSAPINQVGKRYSEGGVQASVGDDWEGRVRDDYDRLREKYGPKIVSLVTLKDGRLTLRFNWKEMHRQRKELLK